MSARRTIIPEWVPDCLPAEEQMFVRKKGRLSSKVLLPYQRTVGRIAWIAIRNEQQQDSKHQKFAFYWNIFEKKWCLVRSGPRPTVSVRQKETMISGLMEA